MAKRRTDRVWIGYRTTVGDLRTIAKVKSVVPTSIAIFDSREEAYEWLMKPLRKMKKSS